MNFNGFIKSLSEITERRLMYLLLAVILIINVVILVLSNGFSGGSYSVMHYQFARWAFANPENLLNSWASPIFTLFAIPFSLLGFKSLQLMNIILGILSGYFAYRVAKELKMKSPLLALVICSFTPVFMMTIFGGTTEIMFAFVAILGTFLLIRNKHTAGALVISLLPLIRLDGLILLPVYAIYFLRKRKAKYAPLMLSTLVFYSLLGLLLNKGLFWLFDGVNFWSSSIYGHGEFTQFIVRSPGFFGIPNEIFFATGLVAGLWLYIRERKEYVQELVLVVLPFLIYFLAHSFAWWLGIGNSQGLSRYMAAIVPFMAVMATRGLYLFAKMFYIIFRSEAVRIGALILGFASIIHIPFAIQNYPVSLSSTDWALSDAADYIKVNGLADSKIFYTDPSVFYFLNNKNPKCNTCIEVKTSDQLASMSNGDLLLFDAIFGAKVGINFDSLLRSPGLKLTQLFYPEVPTFAFGKPYFVALLERTNTDSLAIDENLKILAGTNKLYATMVRYDFDSSTPSDTATVSTSKINRTAYFRIPKRKQNFLESSFAIDTLKPIQPIEIKVSYRQFRKTSDENLRYFVEAQSGTTSFKRIFEIGTPINANPDEWHDVSFSVFLHDVDLTPDLVIKTGFWNKRKGEFLIDDYRVEVAMKQ